MHAVATAAPNIALVKYWGKRDLARNLPAVGSISVTLSDLETRMRVEFDDTLDADRLTVNGQVETRMLPRISRCLDAVAGTARSRARVDSIANFPVAAGLASSASAFAAAVVAAAKAAGRECDRHTLANLAGGASGSAARSLYGGFVELENRDDDVSVRTLREADDWPLRVVVAITSSGPKPVSSGEAMERSRLTSPFYGRWVNEQPTDLAAARAAIVARDFGQLAAVSEHNCLKMHSVMWASRPPIVYWNAATLDCLQRIRELQATGTDVFFTIDAGPQVKAICTPDSEARVAAALAGLDGVKRVMVSGLGPGAALSDDEWAA